MSGQVELVSVIIPAYNVASCLYTAVASVLEQTYGDVEVIIVDDGSTDDTLAVARSFAGDSRVIVLAQDNRGVSAARNAGIKKARGRYCLFLDADEWLLPNAAEVLVGLAEGNPDFVVCCNRVFGIIKSDGNIRFEGLQADLGKNAIDAHSAKLLFAQKSVFEIKNVKYKLFDLNVIRQVGLNFYEGITNKEDGLFFLAYLDCVQGMLYTPECLWVVINRPGSTMNVPYDPKWATAFNAYDLMLGMNSDDTEVYRIVADAKAHFATDLIFKGVSTGLMTNEELFEARAELKSMRETMTWRQSMKDCVSQMLAGTFPRPAIAVLSRVFFLLKAVQAGIGKHLR